MTDMKDVPSAPSHGLAAAGEKGRRRVAVLGAGIAGLVAATELAERGVEAIVFEAGPRVAGMAESHHDPDGFSYDTGAHFITNRLAAAIGVDSRCRTVRHYGEAVYVDGGVAAYPFGLLRKGRYVLSALAARAHRLRHPEVAKTASAFFRSEYGRAMADDVVLPLIEAWSGAPGDDLSAAVGQKIPTSIAQTILLKVGARVTRRAVAIGYCNEMPQSVKVWHVYPEGGVSLLCETLAEALGDAIRLSSPVERVLVEDDRVVGVRVGGEVIQVDGVVSTAPINVLPRLVEGSDRLDRFAGFRFRPMVFANLRFEGRGLLPEVVMWVPDRSFPFFRLTEAPMSMPWLAPEGKTMVTVDLGTEVGSEIWDMDQDALGEACMVDLERLVPGARERYLGCRVVKTPIAYPVFSTDYEEARADLAANGTGVEGLLSVGRNGEFDHILMEDIYWRTKAKVDAWVDGGLARTSARSHGELVV
jgi:protoporphyrinogen oxidase